MSEEQPWPVTAADRKAAVAALVRIIQSDDGPLAIRASRIVISMESQNLRFDSARERLIRRDLAKALK